MIKDTSKPLTHIDSSTKGLLSRLVRDYLRPYMPLLVSALFWMVLSAAMTAAFAKLVEPVLDQVLVNRQTGMIVPVSISVFMVFLISGAATYLHTLQMNKIGQSIVADIQRDLFGRFLGLDLQFFHDNPSGELVSRIVNDVNILRATVSDGLTGIGKNMLTLVLLMGLMIWQDSQLTLVVLVVFPAAALAMNRIGRKLRSISRTMQEETATMIYTLGQIFQGIRQVKAYGMESYERSRADVVIEKVKKLSIKGTRVGTLTTPLNEALLGLALMGVILYGGFHVAAGELTPGELMSFITAFALSYEPIKRLSKLYNTIQQGMGAADRIFAMMDKQAAIQDIPGARILAAHIPEIRFENATFEYADGERALSSVTATLPPGQVTALVGPSGAGKTTIMNLIPRFYDVTQGRILIDGVDVRDLSLSSLRRNIALVSQDVTIFDDTVRANIGYGREGASDEDIIIAARAAAAHDFITGLPQGYDTVLGEDGVKLSGGQRQRISIARAILRNAPILLLDEATSALDNESERLIQDSLAELQKGRTTLVIAHRLSTVQHADQIIVMDAGRVVETGKHDELLTANGPYARMHKAGLNA
ncbi:MAG: ATP-binding cassette domain-containing protein [Micavibrio aeruginosavorus]|uniref:ATP-binding cassette domain-containing protein n=1 Tax=Micavibrio aeruginosavorus TaxID=349221 RepID=A0A7T5R141_9BACT|nr:MAG: ATP-binding cassette domain-containing protein [Micavibrio aeruginosavorus]